MPELPVLHEWSSDYDYSCMNIGRSAAGALYVASFRPGNTLEVMKSTDNGETWIPMDTSHAPNFITGGWGTYWGMPVFENNYIGFVWCVISSLPDLVTTPGSGSYYVAVYNMTTDAWVTTSPRNFSAAMADPTCFLAIRSDGTQVVAYTGCYYNSGANQYRGIARIARYTTSWTKDIDLESEGSISEVSAIRFMAAFDTSVVIGFWGSWRVLSSNNSLSQTYAKDANMLFFTYDSRAQYRFPYIQNGKSMVTWVGYADWPGVDGWESSMIVTLNLTDNVQVEGFKNTPENDWSHTPGYGYAAGYDPVNQLIHFLQYDPMCLGTYNWLWCWRYTNTGASFNWWAWKDTYLTMPYNPMTYYAGVGSVFHQNCIYLVGGQPYRLYAIDVNQKQEGGKGLMRLRGTDPGVTLVNQVAQPVEDLSLGGWTKPDLSTVNLYGEIDEYVRADADYIVSGETPDHLVYRTKLSALTPPADWHNIILEYALWKDISDVFTGSNTLNIKTRLFARYNYQLVDVAQGKPYGESSHAPFDHWGNEFIDGNDNSYWSPHYYGPNNSSWYWVDLQAIYNIDRIRILFGGAPYTILMSDSLDGQNWNLFNTVGEHGSEIIMRPNLHTRYVRLDMNGNHIGYTFSVFTWMPTQIVQVAEWTHLNVPRTPVLLQDILTQAQFNAIPDWRFLELEIEAYTS